MLPVSSNSEVTGDGYCIVTQSPPQAIRRTPTYPHVQHGLVTEEHADLDSQSPHIPAVLSKLHSDMSGLPIPRWPSMLGSKHSFLQPRRPTAFSQLDPQDRRSKSKSSAPGVSITSTPLTSQQSLPCFSQTSNDDRHQLRTTKVPSNTPGICGAVHNPHVDGLIDNSTTSSHPIDQPTAVNPADLLRRPQTGAAVLSQKQLHTTSPEEARKAIRVVIEFFQQQPSGSLEFQDCIALGKMEEKLRCI
jgi:hypothetical protein